MNALGPHPESESLASFTATNRREQGVVDHTVRVVDVQVHHDGASEKTVKAQVGAGRE